MTDHSELDEDMSNSACSLKRCFACCEGQLLHDTQEKRDDRLDDTIIKAEHSSSLGFMNSEADPEHDRLQEWRERDEEASPVEEPEQMQASRTSEQVSLPVLPDSVRDGTVSHSTMSYLSVPPTNTTRRQSLVEVAGSGANSVQSPVEVGSFRSGRSSGREWNWSVRLRRIIYSRTWELISMLVVFCALFLTDVYGAAQVPENTSLDIVMMGCFCFFVLELAANSLVTERYINSFFFWMDIFGTASLVFDISFFLGVDATKPVRFENDEDMSSDTAVLARASRAAKQAARAGRMSRILKLIRFLPFLRNKQDRYEVANAVSLKLTTMLATRVAFLCVGIVIVIPLFGTFVYPVAEDSLLSWAILLSNDIDAYYANATSTSWINSELERFVEFYQNLMYGPFGLCIRDNGSFVCSPGGTIPGLQLPPMDFSEPRRAASIAEVEYKHVLLLYTLEVVRQSEAISNLCLMFSVLLIMLITCFVMNSSVNSVVLKPLQRVVGVLRQHCAEIMKMTFEIPQEPEEKAGRKSSKDLSSNADENKEQEVEMLEKVLVKIVHIFETAVLKTRRTNNEEEAMFLDNFAGVEENDKTQAPIMTLQGADKSEDHSAGVSAEMRKQLEHRSLNLFEEPDEMQRRVALYVMTNTRSCRRWVRRQGMQETLMKFITVIQSKYQANPFHNFGHGLDVLSEVRLYLHRINSYTIFSEVTVFWLLVAALGHDVNHLGVNNQFLVETSHALALKYNDKSVLENLHCSTLFEVLSDASTNVLKVLEKADYKVARAGIVEVILGTDMVRHSEDIKALSIAYTVHQEAFAAAAREHPQELSKALQEDSKARVKVLGSLLHTADISNPMKPWDICAYLADQCLEEFFAQGDQEKELGIPVQMLNDREKVNRCTSQVGFIEFVITPLAEQMVIIFPTLSFLTRNLSLNVELWAELWKNSFDPPTEDYEKLMARVNKVVSRCRAAGPWEEEAPMRQSSAQSLLSGSESVVTEH